MRSFFLIILSMCSYGLAGQNYYDVAGNDGNGFRFWGGSDSYKIHMGNLSEYHYGPVTSYSIKMNMNSTTGRGWTWGVVGETPIAALNNQGDFQVNRHFYSLGKVGIGTTAPDEKLTVKGHVNIGADGNYHLKVRHVDGKSASSTDKDDLYLNYNTGKHVRIGFGTTNPVSNLYVNGNIGAGTNAPTSKMHVRNNPSGGSAHGFSDLTIEDNDQVMVSLLSPNTTNAYLGFADNDDDFVGGIQYNHSNDIMHFRVNNHASDMVINKDGNVGIGTTSPDSELAVKGTIHAEEVKVDLSVPGPDYVFKGDYDLKPLEEVQNYIKENGHLPNIPSALEMEEQGIQLGDMNMKLLEKIEELTLYLLEHREKISQLEKQNKILQNKVSQLIHK